MVLNMKTGNGKSDESRTRRDEQRRKYSTMDKRANDKLVRAPGENGGGQDAQKDLRSRTGRNEKKGKTQEKRERGSIMDKRAKDKLVRSPRKNGGG